MHTYTSHFFNHSSQISCVAPHKKHFFLTMQALIILLLLFIDTCYLSFSCHAWYRKLRANKSLDEPELEPMEEGSGSFGNLELLHIMRTL